jgi:hypothetical protein
VGGGCGGVGGMYVYDDFEYDQRHHGFLLHSDDADTFIIDVADAPDEVHDYEDRIRHCGMSVNAIKTHPS